MIMSRFRSMGLVAGAAASVLSCYMVSLRVARERGEVDRVQQQIAQARQDIRDLTTELGTRGRMTQLERWNTDVLALSAPTAAQYVTGAVALATYQPATAPVLTASATSTVPAATAIPAVAQKSAAVLPAAIVKQAASKTKIETAKASTKAKAKAKIEVAVASAKTKPKTKAETATASSKAKAKAKTEIAAASTRPSLLHNADYVTTRSAGHVGPTRVALLDDGVLGEIGRAAAHEARTGHKAVP